MKKLVFKILLVAGIVSFSSCEEDKKIYDGEGGTLVEFLSSSLNVPVEIDSSKEFDVPFNISTSSSSERTLTISIVDAETTLEDENYTLTTNTVTIPANSFVFNLPITATDISITEEPKSLVLKIESFDGTIGSNEKIKIDVFQTCPVPSDYAVGTYLLEQTSAYVDGPTLSDGATVELSFVDDLTRSFQTENYPDYCGGNFINFSFQLRCNNVIVPNTNSVCACGSGVDWFSAATTPATYDVNDDSVITLTFTDDTQSNCGAPVQTTYTLTKQ